METIASRSGEVDEVSADLPGSEPPHPEAVLHRLRRIEGQVAGIRRMYEEGRYCIDVLDQLGAARAGLERAALLIIADHVNGCVRRAMQNGTAEERAAELLAAAAELREAVRRFLRSV